ncbi:hypothetical protein AKJ09_03456 [Labilithrix luteola]|uniref:Lipoprotein n=1 Tax=Labilithrix luteola TaxID=1391654 RepID=A0A0K1PTF5_9BACT|nr:hypothetical protein [Labilithrix luteola]AKU96792.1 hypothetical protein AKJ09_03456 [Labilithrix luteola]
MRTHRKRLLCISLATCGGLVACNALTGLSDDYRLGQLDSADGAVPPGPDGTSPTDSSTNDVVTPNDGGTDSGRTYDGSFCEEAFKEASVIACSDFESDDPLAWKSAAVRITKSISTVGGNPAGNIEVKDNAGPDGSRALVFSLAPLKAQRELFVGYETVDDAKNFTGFELTADVLLELETNKVEYAEVFQLTFPVSSDTSIVNGYGGASYAGVFGTVAPPASAGLPTVNGADWKALKTTVTGSSTSSFSGKFFVKDQDVSSGNPTVSIRAGAVARGLLGIYHTSNEAYGMKVTFDNVILRRTP